MKYPNQKSSGKPIIAKKGSMRKKCPYSELFRSVFSRSLTEHGENAGKYRPE